jgi:HPt (histidine-containing phosphotransfer) domain-containing protein
VQAWLEELPGRLQETRSSAQDADSDRLREVTHTLKSTCALVDAASAAEMAAGAERTAAAGQIVAAQDIERLVAAAERAATVVRAWLQESESREQGG